MKNLAASLAIAVAYLEERTDACSEDDDVRALEDVAAHLNSADVKEREALAEAFNRLGKPEFMDSLGLSEEE